MPDMTRTFLALPLDDRSRSAAGRLVEKLKVRTQGLRWTAPDNLHLTLAFLGDVETVKLASLTADVKTAVSEQGPFDLTWGGLGCFPTPSRPRIVWLGVLHGGDDGTPLHRPFGPPLAHYVFRPDHH